MGYFFHLTFFLVVHIGSLAVIAGSAWAFGETVLRRLRIDDDDGIGRWALASALGLGLMAQTMFALGILGLFQRWIVLGILAAAHWVCRHTWASILPSTFGDLGRLWHASRNRVSHLVLALACGVPFILMALYPPTGWDATVYHLPYVQSFIEAGRLVFVPELRFPVFPQVAEMGFLLGFFLSGVTAAKLTQTWCVFLTAGLLFSWGRRSFSGRVGLWASALWLGTPLVLWIGSLAYVDIELTLFVTAALYSWEHWYSREDGRGGSDPHDPHCALIGAFVGLAAGTKYLGLFFCGALFVLTAVASLKKRSGRPLVVLVLAAAFFAGPWYLRNIVHTGNPLFPFYAPIFGESDWTSFHDRVVLGEGAAAVDETSIGVRGVLARQASRITDGLAFLVLVPWNGVFHRELFNHQAPLTPLYLILIPLCVPCALASPGPRRLLGLVGVYAVFWLVTVQDLRFLLPIFPVLNLALAFGLERCMRFVGSRVGRLSNVGIAILFLFPGFFYAGYKIHQRGLLPVTTETRQDYLSREIPGYDAIRLLNETEGSGYTAYGLHTSRLCYYADGRLLGDQTGPYAFRRVLSVFGNSPALYDELRGLGARFFLVDSRKSKARLPADRFFAQRFRLVWRDSGFALYEILDP